MDENTAAVDTSGPALLVKVPNQPDIPLYASRADRARLHMLAERGEPLDVQVPPGMRFVVENEPD